MWKFCNTAWLNFQALLVIMNGSLTLIRKQLLYFLDYKVH